MREEFIPEDEKQNLMSEINVFRHYKQAENQFTNSLFSILELSKAVDNSFIPNFFSNCLRIKLPKSKLSFKVLRDPEGGHADAKISNEVIPPCRVKDKLSVSEKVANQISLKKHEEKKAKIEAPYLAYTRLR